MRFSDAKGHDVVSTTTADTVGRIDQFVVDPAAKRVIALGITKSTAGNTLAWSDLIAFGDDAVTVSDAAKISEPSESVSQLTGKDHHLLGKRVLSVAGDEIGQVDDIEFNVESGDITAIVLQDREIDGDRLRGVGSYAVVIDVD